MVSGSHFAVGEIVVETFLCTGGQVGMVISHLVPLYPGGQLKGKKNYVRLPRIEPGIVKEKTE